MGNGFMKCVPFKNNVFRLVAMRPSHSRNKGKFRCTSASSSQPPDLLVVTGFGKNGFMLPMHFQTRIASASRLNLWSFVLLLPRLRLCPRLGLLFRLL